MITCPLCGKPVHLDNDGRDTNTYLTDTDTSNFYCSTYVDVHTGVRWAHYSRRQVLPASIGGLKYIAIIPPFEIWWTSHDQYLLVRQFNIDSADYRLNKIIYEEENVPFDKLPQIYQRWYNLRAFS